MWYILYNNIMLLIFIPWLSQTSLYKYIHYISIKINRWKMEGKRIKIEVMLIHKRQKADPKLQPQFLTAKQRETQSSPCFIETLCEKQGGYWDLRETFPRTEQQLEIENRRLRSEPYDGDRDLGGGWGWGGGDGDDYRHKQRTMRKKKDKIWNPSNTDI